MSDLNARFEETVKNSTSLGERPDNATLLKIYALYKQATEGDVAGKRPGALDLLGRGRYDGWAAYAQSKLANLLHAKQLALRLSGSGVTVPVGGGGAAPSTTAMGMGALRS